MRQQRHRLAVHQLVEHGRIQHRGRHVAVFGRQALQRILHVAHADLVAVHPGHHRVRRLAGGGRGAAAAAAAAGPGARAAPARPQQAASTANGAIQAKCRMT